MEGKPNFLALGREDFQVSKEGLQLGMPEIALRWAVQTVGWRKWKARRHEFLNKLGALKFESRRLQERHCIELIVPDTYERMSRGENIWQGDQFILAYAIAFCNALMVLSRALSPQGKRRLEGMIKDALSRDYGFGVIRSEIDALYQLLDAGFRVAATDLERKGNFDFLAESEGEEIEVECKMLTQEIGTHIPPADFERLLSHIREDDILTALGTGRTCIINLIVEEKIPSNSASLAAIAKAILGILRGRESNVRRLGIDFKIEECESGTGRESLVMKLSKEARRITDRTGRQTMAYSSEDRGAILSTWSRADSPGRGFNAIKQPLKKAASQLTGTRPGVVFVVAEGLGAAPPEYKAAVAGLVSAILSQVGLQRTYLEGFILQFSGSPFSSHDTLWLENPYGGKGARSAAFRTLRSAARPGAKTPAEVLDWQIAWQARWR